MSKAPSAAERRWREIVARQRASGLGVAAFCREHDVAASSLFAWKRKLGGVPASLPAAFVEARVMGAAAAAGAKRASIELCLRGGRRLRVRATPGRSGGGLDGALLEVLVALAKALEAMA